MVQYVSDPKWSRKAPIIKWSKMGGLMGPFQVNHKDIDHNQHEYKWYNQCKDKQDKDCDSVH